MREADARKREAAQAEASTTTALDAHRLLLRRPHVARMQRRTRATLRCPTSSGAAIALLERTLSIALGLRLARIRYLAQEARRTLCRSSAALFLDQVVFAEDGLART